MINEQRFRLKKNGEPNCMCFCRHPELIENYDKAITDETQVWECHHRLESCFTQKFLIDMGLYYDVEPEALIFLTKAEHSKIDSYCKRIGETHKGKKHSEETKKKISETLKGQKPVNCKKVLCVETGVIYESTREAYKQTGIHYSNISTVCHGKLKTTGGYHWSFV